MSLRLEGVVARLGPRRRPATVLDGVTVEAPAGRLTAVVGPSGSGKTSLLRVAAGLLEPAAGSVHVDGADVTRLPPGRRRVALCFQDLALFPHLDVARNLGFGLRARKVPAADVDRRVREVADALELGPLLHRLPRQLSGGEAQRVALGRAVVGDPAVLLLDEPFGALDPDLRAAARRHVREAQRRLGATAVLVTHDPLEAAAMADHLVVLLGGRVAQAGPPDEVAARPATPEVARLVGHPPMNVVAGLAWHVVGVRPEHVRLVAPGAGRVDGVVDAVEPWAGRALLRIRVPGADVAAVVEPAAAPPLGAATGLAWDPSAEHRFGSAEPAGTTADEGPA